MTGMRGKIHRRLSGRISATDDHYWLTKAWTNINRCGRVVDASPLETLQSFHSQLPVVGAGGNHNRPCRNLLVTVEAHNERVFRTVNARHRSANSDGGSKLFGLHLRLFG